MDENTAANAVLNNGGTVAGWITAFGIAIVLGVRKFKQLLSSDKVTETANTAHVDIIHILREQLEQALTRVVNAEALRDAAVLSMSDMRGELMLVKVQLQQLNTEMTRLHAENLAMRKLIEGGQNENQQ